MSSLSVFLWSNRDGFNLNQFKRPEESKSDLKEFERLNMGWLDLNQVKGNAVYRN